MKGILITLFMISGIANAGLPVDYMKLTSAEKRDLLWSKVSKAEYSSEELPTENPGFFESLALLKAKWLEPSFTHESDEMPVGRKKLIHTYGSVAKVRLEITKENSGSSVTGCQARGPRWCARSGDYIVIRSTSSWSTLSLVRS